MFFSIVAESVHGALRGKGGNLWRLSLLAVFLVGITIGSALLVKSFMPDLAGLKQYGYAGTFLLGLAVNATVLMPPVLMGATLPPLLEFANHSHVALVAMVYALGATTGELSGCGVGMGSAKLLRVLGLFGWRGPDQSGFSRSIERLLKRSWLWIALLTVTPFPPFDMAGIIAGGLRYPLRKFFLACLLGRTGKYLFLLTVGDWVWSMF